MALTKVSGGGLKDVDLGSENLTTTGSVTGASLIPTSSTVPTDGIYLPGTNQVAISTGSTGRLFINSSGNVGIGTANAVANLTVYGTASAALFQNSNTGSGSSDGFFVGNYGGISATVWQYENDIIQFGTNNIERARIDSSGRLLVGRSASASSGDSQYAKLQVQANTTGSTGSALLSLQRGEAAASITSGQTLGSILFDDIDGNNYASITAQTDDASGPGDYPGRLIFYTTADGSGSPTERMRIASTGAFGLSGANYGTSGQVLTSQGSSAAPQWATPAGGKILQVVQTIKTDTDSSTSTTFVDISGLSATITPSSTSSKILVFVGIGCASSQYDQRGVLYRILRGSTPIGQGDNAQTGPCGWGQMSYESYVNGSHSPVILDSPATTSATTYKVQWHISAGMTFYLNRTYSGTTGLFQRRAASTITLMEVQG